MTYCVTLKSKSLIIFNSNMIISDLLADIEKNKWIEVVSSCEYERLRKDSYTEYEDVETNRCMIRTCEIQSIDYYVEARSPYEC